MGNRISRKLALIAVLLLVGGCAGQHSRERQPAAAMARYQKVLSRCVAAGGVRPGSSAERQENIRDLERCLRGLQGAPSPPGGRPAALYWADAHNALVLFNQLTGRPSPAGWTISGQALTPQEIVDFKVRQYGGAQEEFALWDGLPGSPPLAPFAWSLRRQPVKDLKQHIRNYLSSPDSVRLSGGRVVLSPFLAKVQGDIEREKTTLGDFLVAHSPPSRLAEMHKISRLLAAGK